MTGENDSQIQNEKGKGSGSCNISGKRKGGRGGKRLFSLRRDDLMRKLMRIIFKYLEF